MRNNGSSNPSTAMDQPLNDIIVGVMRQFRANMSTTTQAMLTTNARIVGTERARETVAHNRARRNGRDVIRPGGVG